MNSIAGRLWGRRMTGAGSHARFQTLLIAMFALLAASELHATVGPPVDALLLGEPRITLPGETFSDVLEITALEAGTITGITILGGDGWSNASHDGPSSVSLAKDESLLLGIEALAVDPDVALVIAYEFEGEPVRHGLDLSARAFDLATRVQDFITIGGSQETALPQPSPPHLFDPAETGERVRDFGSRGTRDIDVTGRIVYRDSNDFETGAFGLTVEVRDDDLLGSSLLGTTTTDGNGNFEVTVEWDGGILDPDPDIFIRARSENDDFKLTADHWTTPVYKWENAVESNVGGSSLNVGKVQPADDSQYPALHLFSTICWIEKWLLDTDNPGVSGLKIRWPCTDCDGSYYGYGRAVIHPGDEWPQNKMGQVAAYYWAEEYSHSPSRNYCNGICDSPTHGCSSCYWCEENADMAWFEGFAFAFAWMVTSDLQSLYGVALIDPFDIEYLDECEEDGEYGSSLLTPGFFAALVYDMIDDNAEWANGWRDVMEADPKHVLDAFQMAPPASSSQFILCFRDLYPYWREELWMLTQRNLFPDFDESGPEAIDNLSSTTHVTEEESANPIIRLLWTAPDDDFSGADAYSILLDNVPTLPDEKPELTDVSGTVIEWATPSLTAGTYYINVRARDRSGRWSDDYGRLGPFFIREPELVDVTPVTPVLWDGSLVLRDDSNAGTGVYESEFLRGDVEDTYWNLAIRNEGDWDTSDFHAGIYVDGEASNDSDASLSVDGIDATTTVVFKNQGPFTVPGGRHTISARLDDTHQLGEGDETNNTYAVQRIFEPQTIPEGVVVERSSPPDPNGGKDDYTGGGPLVAENQDGVRIAASPNRYEAVAMWNSDLATDYDLALHDESTGQTDGFQWSVLAEGLSSRGAGHLNLVLANQFWSGSPDAWDVGVINRSEGTTPYDLLHIGSVTISSSLNEGLTLVDDRVGAFDFYLPSGRIGWNTIRLRGPASIPLNAAWVPSGWVTGGLADAAVMGTTDELGELSLSYEVTAFGNNCLIIWRDPKDDDPTAGSAFIFDVDVRLSDPDLTAGNGPGGWHSPLVPLPDDSATPASVPLPPALLGDAPSTYINVAAYNDGLENAPPTGVEVRVDGEFLASGTTTPVPVGGYGHLIDDGPHTIAGGRHFLTGTYDPDDVVAEGNERNNVYGEQYVWEPPNLPLGTAVSRDVPTFVTGGWDEVDLEDPDETLYFNCDGVRVSPGAEDSWAIAALPNSVADVDLRLHAPASDTKNGFDESFAFSGWSTGESDFIIVNVPIAGGGARDVGLLGTYGGGSVTVEATETSSLGTDPEGEIGPFPFPEGAVLRIHEVELSAGAHEIALAVDSGPGIDWGLSIHSGSIPYASKSTALDGGLAWLEAQDLGENISFTVEEAGRFIVAVWSALPQTGTGDGSYSLQFQETTSVPVSTHDFSVRNSGPNPFSATTSFELRLPESGMLEVDVFDTSGKRVRQLFSTSMTSGTHRLDWDGRDDSGRLLNSGVYHVRIRHGGASSARAVTLIR